MVRLFFILFAAPHRLPFLVGVTNLVGLAAWWFMRLTELYFGLAILPQTSLPASLLHGPVMLFLIFPPFIFGFLLTVFPRWMGYPDLPARRYGPLAAVLALSSIFCIAGLFLGSDIALLVGLGLLALAWTAVLVNLAAVLVENWREGKDMCWHGVSALACIIFGLTGLGEAIRFVISWDAEALHHAVLVGTFAFLVPVFVTVAHRMVPFFAGNIVADYQRWKPFWVLAAFWIVLLAHLVFRLGFAPGLLPVSALGLFALSGLMAWRWWPRSPAPAFLMVLLWGFAWLPAAFLLAALDAIDGTLTRAADHALYIGFALSVVIAMVTRVTHGHSGRPLVMPVVGWLAFATVQIVAIGRVVAALEAERGMLLVPVAGLLLVGTAPWAIRCAAIYLSARMDGNQG